MQEFLSDPRLLQTLENGHRAITADYLLNGTRIQLPNGDASIIYYTASKLNIQEVGWKAQIWLDDLSLDDMISALTNPSEYRVTHWVTKIKSPSLILEIVAEIPQWSLEELLHALYGRENRDNICATLRGYMTTRIPIREYNQQVKFSFENGETPITEIIAGDKNETLYGA
ncbi:MAG: hypothetical protein D6698_09820, partial [Gammaproteobacteria bacterium]